MDGYKETQLGKYEKTPYLRRSKSTLSLRLTHSIQNAINFIIFPLPVRIHPSRVLDKKLRGGNFRHGNIAAQLLCQIPLDIHPRTGFQRLRCPVRKGIPRMNRVGFVNHPLLTVAVRMPQLADDVRSVTRRRCLDESENRAGKEKFVHG